MVLVALIAAAPLSSCGSDDDEDLTENPTDNNENGKEAGTLTETTASGSTTYKIVNASCKDNSQESLSLTKLTLYGELRDKAGAWWGEVHFECENRIGGKKTLSEVSAGDTIWNLRNSTWKGVARPKNSGTESGDAVVKAMNASEITIEFKDYAFYQWSSISSNKWLVTLNGVVSFPIKAAE